MASSDISRDASGLNNNLTKGDVMYYNTNKETGSTLESSQKTTETQEVLILAFFRANKGALYGPSQIASRVFHNSVPLTSVRRGMTNLTYSRHLEKTDNTVDGSYGKQEHTWTLADKE
jgi:hypothetical protein